METSFEEIMTQDFERFFEEDMGALADLNFKALGVVPGSRKSAWRAFWRQAIETAADFNLWDYLIFASPAAALAVVVFIGKPFVTMVLRAYTQGM